MKKFLALTALVAMVAVSSVAYGAAGDVPVSVTVESGVILNMDTCTSTGLLVGSMGASSLDTTAACNFIVSANGSHDVYVTDDEDNTSTLGGNDDETCGVAGCITSTNDVIEGVDDTGFLGQLVAAGTAEVGYYISTAAGDTVAQCTGVGSVCTAKDTESGRPIDNDTNVNDLDNFTLGMAVSTNSDQAAEAYTDTWVLNLVLGT